MHRALPVLGAAFLLLPAAPASAAFHLMRVNEVLLDGKKPKLSVRITAVDTDGNDSLSKRKITITD